MNYIDGFAFPISLKHLDAYKKAAESIAGIWKEHGALAYFEFVSDGKQMEATRSFSELLGAKEEETTIFGWVAFESKESCELAHKKVAGDPRMVDLVAPLMEPTRMIFDAGRMAYAQFKPFIRQG